MEILLININKKFNVCLKKAKKKDIDILGVEVYREILFLRRLFIDWIILNRIKFIEFKSYMEKKIYIDNNLDNDKFSDIVSPYKNLWKEVNKFLLDCSDYLINYRYIIMPFYFKSYKLKLSKKQYDILFSLICCVMFYRWRKEYNDLVRKWQAIEKRKKRWIKI